MKVAELQTIISNEVAKSVRAEVTKIVKAELPKMIKPMVQEAVAGALANLLAEGIVNGPPEPKSRVLTPNIPQAKGSNTSGSRTGRPAAGLDSTAKRSLAEKMGYGDIDRIGINVPVSTGNITADILNETAMEMGHSNSVESVLDVAGDLGGAVSPEAVEALTRNYSDLMKAMNKRGNLNG